jgi:hypothetical protein
LRKWHFLRRFFSGDFDRPSFVSFHFLSENSGPALSHARPISLSTFFQKWNSHSFFSSIRHKFERAGKESGDSDQPPLNNHH